MKEIKYVITDPEGFHARPAATFVKAIREFESSITVIKDGKKVNGKSMMALMTLGVKSDQEITVRVEGDDEAAAIERVEAALKENL